MVGILSTLGARLSDFGHTPTSQRVISEAVAQNGWFTPTEITTAVEAIRATMLKEEALQEWLSRYRICTTPKRVAIIMAGNIPLVGFFDLLCTLCSGHTAYVKPSSKDRVMTDYVIDLLKEIEPSIPIYTYAPTEQYDLAIATGSDEANDYFRRHFATTRALLRGSRHSVALLDGTETEAELQGLMRDITLYSGSGCRSVSLIFAPRGTEIDIPRTAPTNPKLGNNLRSRRALYTIQKRPFDDYLAFLLVEGKEFPTSLAEVALYRYDDIAEVERWLDAQHNGIQCVVSHLPLPNAIPFGQAQYPTLSDYADGVDTMLFLGNEPIEE
ncbi:MAG: aldehyde dehydrogenase [Alistipes sp.]|nr:aldehyde dehydrogenase [Alistipes sp.]